MTPIEAAIQAATNAGTASGFAQALEQTAQNLLAQREQLIHVGYGDRPLDIPAETRRLSEYLKTCVDALQQEAAKRREQVDQLQKVSNAAIASALQGMPDMARIRGAVAVLMGAG
jgi:hypothetical protein